MSLIRKHVAVLQAWACLALVYQYVYKHVWYRLWPYTRADLPLRSYPDKSRGHAVDEKESPVLDIALLTWVRLVTRSTLQSRKWQLIGESWWYRSALYTAIHCRRFRTVGLAVWPADIPPLQSTTLDLHLVARKLNVLHPAEGRRLSWFEHTV